MRHPQLTTSSRSLAALVVGTCLYGNAAGAEIPGTSLPSSRVRSDASDAPALPAAWNEARKHELAGDPGRAAAVLSRAAEADGVLGADYAVELQLGWLYFDAGDTQQAAEHYQDGNVLRLFTAWWAPLGGGLFLRPGVSLQVVSGEVLGSASLTAESYLSAGAGNNLPMAVARLAAGQRVKSRKSYRVGTMFVRISIDQLAHIDDVAAISTTGELRRKARPMSDDFHDADDGSALASSIPTLQ